MKTILVPTDFSPNALKALEYAGALAQKAGARIMLIHGCTLLDDRYARHREMIQKANEVQVDELTKELNALKQQTAEKWQVAVSVHLFKTDNITECILQISEEEADLVVLGTHGKTGLRRKIFGSKAADVINRCTKPVISIPQEYEIYMPAKILIAVNSSEQQPNSFRPVYDIAALFGSSVFLASYVKDGAEAHELVTRLHHLQSFCTRLNHVYPGLSTETASIDGTDFHEALRQYITDNGIHLLVMVTRERSFWQQVVDSSATQKMSYHIEVPLLSLHHD